MHSLIKVVFCLAVIKFVVTEKSVLLKLKSDVDKVGKDFENLVFDVVKKIVADVSVKELDYYSSDEDSGTQKAATQNSITKKILNDLLENTTEISTTEKNGHITKKLTGNKDILLTRVKRSINQNSSIPILQDKSVNDSPIANNTPLCAKKSPEEQSLELQTIEDLKEEIKKLHDLVILLKDQQRILSFLDKNSKTLDSDITSRFDAKDLLKVLDYVNTRNIQEQKTKDFGDRSEDGRRKISSFEEMANIKNQLKETIGALNKTREVLIKERKKGLLLEKELNDQRLDLNFLKMMVKKLYKTDINFPRDNIDDDILGAVQLLPKDLRRDNQVVENMNEDEDKLQLENNDLSDLERMLHRLRQPKKASVESKMLELKREIEKKKQEEEVLKQLKNIQKRLQQGTEPQKSRTSPEAESEILKKLKNMMTGAEETRSLDEDVELELRKLQEAIDNLRPNDELDLSNETPENQKEEDEVRQFQDMFNRLFDRRDRKQEDERKFEIMMNKMFAQEGKKEEDPTEQIQIMLDKMANQGRNNRVKVNPEIRVNGLLLKEVMELRKQLASIEKSKVNSGDVYSTDGSHVPKIMSDGYGTPPGAINYPPYMPYINPSHQNRMSRYYKGEMNVPPNNGHYTNFLSPISYASTQFNPQNSAFGRPNRYNFDDNPEKNIHQMHYSEPKRPEQLNVHPLFGENLYQKNFLEPHQMSYTAPVGQNGFEPNVYQKASTVHDWNAFRPEDRNRLFLDFTKPISGTFYYPELPPGSSASEPAVNPPEIAENVINTYQKVEDLKTQIYNLQNIIDDLNNPSYTQTPQDREVIVSLEKQIGDLKGAIDNIDPNTVPPSYGPNLPNAEQNVVPPEAQQNFPNHSRRKRSVQNEEPESDSKIFDQVVSGIKQMIFDKDIGKAGRPNYEDIQKRIDALRNELETKTPSKAGQGRRISPIVSYQPPYRQPNHFSFVPSKPDQFGVFTSKKNDIFTSIVIKILDKIIAATPAVLERLFGYGIGELSNFEDYSTGGDNYNYKVDHRGQNDVQKLFKSLGFFGYGPLILLKLLDGFTTFVKILRKNAFFKNFLMPALVLLVVAGAVIFLIWWLQTSEEYYLPNSDLGRRSYYRVNNDKYDRRYANYNYRGDSYDHSYNRNSYDRNYNGYGYGEGYGS